MLKFLVLPTFEIIYFKESQLSRNLIKFKLNSNYTMAPCPLNNVFFNSKKNLMIMNPSYLGWQILNLFINNWSNCINRPRLNRMGVLKCQTMYGIVREIRHPIGTLHITHLSESKDKESSLFGKFWNFSSTPPIAIFFSLFKNEENLQLWRSQNLPYIRLSPDVSRLSFATTESIKLGTSYLPSLSQQTCFTCTFFYFLFLGMWLYNSWYSFQY